jgi:hypothetical protein
MRSVKALDAAFRFMCGRRTSDRSLNGLSLALTRDVPAPRRLAAHIDESDDPAAREGRLAPRARYERVQDEALRSVHTERAL